MVISLPRPSQFSAELTGGINHQYMSRLWSCDTSLMDYLVRLYRVMLTDFFEIVNIGRYIDIEHLLYKHLDRGITTSADNIGVTGLLAPNGAVIKD